MWGFGSGSGSPSGDKRKGKSDIEAQIEDAIRSRADELEEYLQSLSGQLQERIETSVDSNTEYGDELRKAKASINASLQTIASSPPLLIATTLAVAASSYGIYTRYFRRIPTAAHFTPTTLRWRRMLIGKCTSVGDADGFRLYHTPGPPVYRGVMYGGVPVQSNGGASHGSGNASNGSGFFSKSADKGKSKAPTSQTTHHPPNTQTISVRLAGADAPEMPHFGRPGQKFGPEAMAELKRLVLGRTVWCQIAHLDQYQRLVATPYVWLPPYIFGRTNVSLQLVKEGLATVYTQGGAAYGNAGLFTRFMRWLLSSTDTSYKDINSNTNTSKEKRGWTLDPRAKLIDLILPLSGEARLKRAMARAKRRRIGIWSQRHIETPEEYKKRVKG